jgi:hypothetical protein
VIAWQRLTEDTAGVFRIRDIAGGVATPGHILLACHTDCVEAVE